MRRDLGAVHAFLFVRGACGNVAAGFGGPNAERFRCLFVLFEGEGVLFRALRRARGIHRVIVFGDARVRRNGRTVGGNSRPLQVQRFAVYGEITARTLRNAVERIQFPLFPGYDGALRLGARLVRPGKRIRERFGARVIGIRGIGHRKCLVDRSRFVIVDLRVDPKGLFPVGRAVDQIHIREVEGELLGKVGKRSRDHEYGRNVRRKLIDGRRIQFAAVELEQADVFDVVDDGVHLFGKGGGDLPQGVERDVSAERFGNLLHEFGYGAVVRFRYPFDVARQPAGDGAHFYRFIYDDDRARDRADKDDEGQKDRQKLSAQAEIGFYHILPHLPRCFTVRRAAR